MQRQTGPSRGLAVSASLEAQGTLSLLPEILLLETGGRPSLDVVFVAVCDAVLRALKGERWSPLPTSPSGSASARLAQNQTAEISSLDSGVGARASQYLAPYHYRRIHVGGQNPD